MEAEDRISEVKDRMVEINESERKKEKQKKWGQSQRPPGQYEMLQHLNYRSPRRRPKERPWENTWGDNSWKLH